MPSTQTDRLAGLTTSVAVKAPVRVVATGPITLSGEQSVTQTAASGVRVVAVVDGDRVGVAGQTDSTQNGIWLTSTSGWTRALDFDGSRDVVDGTTFYSEDGNCWRVVCTNPVTIDTTPISIQQSFGTRNAGASLDLGNVTGAVTLDLTTYVKFECVAVGNVTFGNPANYQIGDDIEIHVTQDGTGSRTGAFGGNWTLPAGSALSTAPGAKDIVYGRVVAGGLVTGRISNGVSPFGSAATRNKGVSVDDPGTNTLEMMLRTASAATTGNAYVFLAADLQTVKRRTNSGTAMGDTLQASGATGLADGAVQTVMNLDSTANLTLTAGAGTTVAGAATLVLSPGLSAALAYNLAQTDWRVIWIGLGSPPTVTAFTPTLSFANAGDLAVTYTTQFGIYYKIGRRVYIHIDILTATFTWTTSTSSLVINGLPFAAVSGFNAGLGVDALFNAAGTLVWPNTSTMMRAAINAGETRVRFNGQKSAATAVTGLAVGGVPTGSNVTVSVSGDYLA